MAVHPGMMIKPELDERGISQKEFAKMLGTQPSHLSEVLNGKRALTTELAVKIENAIGLPAKIPRHNMNWNRLLKTTSTKLWQSLFLCVTAASCKSWFVSSAGLACSNSD